MFNFSRTARRAAFALSLLSVLDGTAVLRAQPTVQAGKLVVYRRQQILGAAAYTWAQFQDGALVQSFASVPITVPTGQHFVLTGVRYWFTGTGGGNFAVGPASGGNVNNFYSKTLTVPPGGILTTLEGFEHFTNGISFPSGAKVDIKLNKSVAASTDTVVWCWLYGYFE